MAQILKVYCRSERSEESRSGFVHRSIPKQSKILRFAQNDTFFIQDGEPKAHSVLARNAGAQVFSASC